MSKVQSQLLVSEVTRDRADRLALIRQEPRAEVYRLALEGSGIPGMEKSMSAQIAHFDELADAFGMRPLELARKAVEDRYTLAELEGRKRYPARK